MIRTPQEVNRVAIWRDRQARYTVGDLVKAIRGFCCQCNQVERWEALNDCLSPECALFPYRPGEQRPEVAGVRRAVKSAGRVEQGRRNGHKANGGCNNAPRIAEQMPARG